MNYLNINVPYFFAGLDTAFLYDEDPSPTNERLPVEVFQYTSIPQRCGLFSVMTEYGSQHARVPIQYLSSLNVDTPTAYPLDWIQLWDSVRLQCVMQHHRLLQEQSSNDLVEGP